MPRGLGLAVEQHLRGREADEYREQHGQRRALDERERARAGGQRPTTMPGAMPRTRSQRTAPRGGDARRLEIEVNRMVAIEVAMAIFTARPDSTPRDAMMKVTKGTISMPPPMPSSPARKPVKAPRARNSASSAGRAEAAATGEGFREDHGLCRLALDAITNTLAVWACIEAHVSCRPSAGHRAAGHPRPLFEPYRRREPPVQVAHFVTRVSCLVP